MDDLQTGDILKRKSDGSEWRFLHYKPVNDMGSTRSDKRFVHVKEWDDEKKEWKNWDIEGGHQEFPVTEFEKA